MIKVREVAIAYVITIVTTVRQDEETWNVNKLKVIIIEKQLLKLALA